MATIPDSTHESDIKIVTSYDPNAGSQNKWIAWEDYYPNGPIGTGRTENAAVNDLFEQIARTNAESLDIAISNYHKP
jgi:hypothetical protein